MSSNRPRAFTVLKVLFVTILVIHGNYGKSQHNQLIQQDSTFIVGTLPNGFTYILKRMPSTTVEIRLAVKVGNGHNPKGQGGIAHLVEHLALWGSKDYPNGLIKELENHGLTAGVHFNASTGFDNTTYYLSLPRKDSLILDLTLSLLKGVCSDLTFEPHAVTSELGAVQAEGMDGSSRLAQQREIEVVETNSWFLAKHFNKARWNEVATLKRSDLVEFYNSYYNPASEAIVIVGDIELLPLKSKLENLFSSVPPKSIKQVSHDSLKVTLFGQDHVNVFFRDNILRAEVTFYNKQKLKKDISKEEELTMHVVNHIYSYATDEQMKPMERRYFPILRSFNSSFVQQEFYPPLSISSLTTRFIVDSLSQLKSAIQSATRELNRIAKNGLSESQVQNLRVRVLKDIDQSILTPTQAAVILSDSYISDTAITDPIEIQQKKRKILLSLTTAQINSVIESWIKKTDLGIAIEMPSKWRKSSPPTSAILSWVEEAKMRPLSSPKEALHYSNQMMSRQDMKALKPKPYKIYTYQGLDLVKMTLANGIEVYVKKIRRQGASGGVINLSFFGPEGSNNFSEPDRTMAKYAPEIVNESGYAGKDKFELQELHHKHGITLDPYITDHEHGLSATSNEDSFDLLMQSIYKCVTTPNYNEEAFLSWKIKKNRITKHPRQSGDYEIWDSLRYGARVFLNEDEATINKIDLNAALNIYRQIFCQTGKLKVIITADKLESALVITNKYLSSLKSCASFLPSEHIKPSNYVKKYDKGPKIYTIIKGKKDGSAFVGISMYGEENSNPLNPYKLMVVQDIIETTLFQRLREKEGAVYGVNVDVRTEQKQGNRLSISISYRCDSTKTHQLLRSVIEELRSLAFARLSVDLLQRSKSQTLGKIRSTLTQNIFWINYLTSHLRTEDDINEILNYNKLVTETTIEDVKKLITLALIDSYSEVIVL